MDKASNEQLKARISIKKQIFWVNVIAVFAWTFLAYTDLFLQYLILSFAKKKSDTEMIDPITGKVVANVVFMKNERLLEQALTDNLEMNAQRKEQLKVEAQMNEYLYSLMKQEGIADRIDEDIGFDFMDFNMRRKSSLIMESKVSEYK